MVFIQLTVVRLPIETYFVLLKGVTERHEAPLLITLIAKTGQLREAKTGICLLVIYPVGSIIQLLILNI